MKLWLYDSYINGKVGSITDNAQRYGVMSLEGEVILRLALGRISFEGILKGETIIKAVGGEQIKSPAQINIWNRENGKGFIVESLSYIEVIKKTPETNKVIGVVFSKKEMIELVQEHTGFNLSD